MKKLTLDDLQEKARLITREKLKEFVIPAEIKTENLFLEIGFEGDYRIFYLYKSNGESPKKDFLISETKIDVYGKEIEVKVFLQKKENFE